MKCSDCGADNPPSAKFCQYCSSPRFVAMAVAGVQSQAQSKPQATAANYVTAPADTKVPGYIDNLLRIKNLPVNPFRWLPFLFTFMYLAGRGNTQEATRTGAILLAGSALACLFALLGFRGVIPLITIASYVFNIYYASLVSG